MAKKGFGEDADESSRSSENIDLIHESEGVAPLLNTTNRALNLNVHFGKTT